MISKSFKFILSISIGLLLCSCTTSSHNETDELVTTQAQPTLQQYLIIPDDPRLKNQRLHDILANQKTLLDENYQRLLKEQEYQKQLAKSKPCFSPVYEDGTCIRDWSDLEKISCKPGFFNTVKEGGLGMFGKVLTFEEADELACNICWKGHYCPGDGHRYECPAAKELGATTCPSDLDIEEEQAISPSKNTLDTFITELQTEQENPQKENNGIGLTIFNMKAGTTQSLDEYVKFFEEHPSSANQN